MAEGLSFISVAAAHPTVRQFLRFAGVGVVGTIVHYSTLIALVQLAGFGVLLATTLGFLAGVVATYLLNRWLTFSSRQPMGLGFLKYAVALSVGLLINTGLVAALHAFGAPYLIAQPLATGVVLFWNFGASRFLVFRT